MILIIDNYDSFTYNTLQIIGGLGFKLKVVRNDKTTLRNIVKIDPTHIIISPGPGSPVNAGISVDLVKRLKGEIPILGICLGHQCIGAAFGGRIIRTDPRHGKTDVITHDDKSIFKGIANPFIATRYHSLIVDRQTLPDCLEVSATNNQGLIMGLRHKQYKLEGIQVHPESILTSEGKKILKNFITC